MPEKPEVITVVNSLKDRILGKKITGCNVFWDNIIASPTVDEFKKEIINQKINDITTRGKFIVMELDDYSLLVHLRMEGKYFIKPKEDEVVKHEHIIFEFTDGVSLRYADVRKFGTMEIRSKEDLFTTHPLSSLGMEANMLTKEYLKEKMESRHRDLKAFLLDQTMIAGIGNIYADEICFLANLNPAQDIFYLDDNDYEAIADAAKVVINKAILAGGTTIRSYTSSLGVTGLFQLQLNVHTKKGDINKTAEVKIVNENGLNIPYLVEGTLPEKINEIAVTKNYIAETGKKVGDVVVIEELLDTDEESDDVKNFMVNVLMECLELGDYVSDFVITKNDGELMVRECVFRDKISRPLTCKMLDASREYWKSHGITDWGIVVDKAKGGDFDE